MKTILILIGLCTAAFYSSAQNASKAKVDYDGFLEMTKDIAAYRQARVIDIETFNQFAGDPKTIILDTRSKWAYDVVHVAGAVHLNFSDFTQAKLDALIPSKDTRILIYCNNNFAFDQLQAMGDKVVELALNIPTFINLYGYGYTNIYELEDYLNESDERVKFEGTGMPVIQTNSTKTDILLEY